MRSLHLFLVMLICGCTNTKHPQSGMAADTPAADSLVFRYDSVKVYANEPVSPDTNYTDTAKAEIRYPVFSDTAITRLLERHVASTIEPGNNYPGYRAIADNFIAAFEKDKASNPGRKFMWFMGMDLQVASNSESLLSVLNTYFSYQGGAHPNTVYLSYNLNPHTRQFLTIDSLLKPGGRAALDTLAERIFRKNEGLAPAQSLSGNYFFENDRFRLPQTFVVIREGIQFTYSPYEIKPYAAGKTNLLVPFSQLKSILKDEYAVLSGDK